MEAFLGGRVEVKVGDIAEEDVDAIVNAAGAFQYPRHEAAQVSSSTIRQFLDRDSSLQLVPLVFFSHPDAASF